MGNKAKQAARMSRVNARKRKAKSREAHERAIGTSKYNYRAQSTQRLPNHLTPFSGLQVSEAMIAALCGERYRP